MSSGVVTPMVKTVLVVTLVVGSVVSAASSSRAAGTAESRTFVARDLHLTPGQPFSVSLHPGVDPIEVRASPADVEVCQASMEGGAAGVDGQSWPSYAHFEGCLLPDDDGVVTLPSIVIPSWHVAFLVHGRDDAPVDLRSLRITYVPGDGYFGFSAPTFTPRRPAVTFSVTPRNDHSVAVETTVRTRTRVRARQGGAAVPLVTLTDQDTPGARRFGPVDLDRPVTVQVGGAPGGRRAACRGSCAGIEPQCANESDTAKSPAGSVHHSASRSPAAASSRSTPSRRNLALISVRSSSPAANSHGHGRDRRS